MKTLLEIGKAILAARQTRFYDFRHHLGDFGRHLGPSWAPRGSQNRAFWHQVVPKSQKMRPRMRHQKIYEHLIEIL